MEHNERVRKARDEYDDMILHGSYTLVASLNYCCKKYGVERDEVLKCKPKQGRVRKSNAHSKGQRR